VKPFAAHGAPAHGPLKKRLFENRRRNSHTIIQNDGPATPPGAWRNKVARLCVPLTEKTTETMLASMHSLPPAVDLVELRLDMMEQFDLAALLRRKDRPVIVTSRSTREGGHWRRTEQERLETLRRAVELGADFIDVEISSLSALGETPGGTGRILSYHNFVETPANLEELFVRIKALGADIVKIAVKANDIVDTLPVLDLLAKHAAAHPTIALSVGEEGLPTRILAAKLGAFLTFASAEAGKESADGQVPWKTMLELYRFSKIGPTTTVYGVVANPVAHSMSPVVHNAAFGARGLDAVYLPFKVAECAAFLDGYQRYDLGGLSVTIPHKEAMLSLMNQVDDLAAQIGAVNTVHVKNGRRYGYNTDVQAAISSIEEAAIQAGFSGLGKLGVLMVGAGGAARAIAYGLRRRVRRLVIANRTVSRGKRLAEEVGAEFCPLSDLESVRFDVLVNTTSVGMHPDVNQSPVPAGILKKGKVVFDAVYNPPRTRLLREAEEVGCSTATGLDWFVRQAAAQFEIWTGQEAPASVIEAALRQGLAR